MKPKTTLMLNLIISVIFAALIVFSDSLFGTENEDITNWLIASWLIPFTLLSVVGIKNRD